MKPRHLIAAMLLLPLPALAFAATPPVYLPLDANHEWRYITPEGVTDSQQLTGVVQLVLPSYPAPVMTYALTWMSGGPQSGLVQFYNVGSGGEVLLFGFDRPSDSFGIIYDPPLRLVQPPLALGATWQDVTTAYFTYGGAPATLTVDWEVDTAGPLEVPAGPFFAYGIGSVAAQQAAVSGAGAAVLTVGGVSYALTGEKLASSSTTPVDWWSEGVGRVQYVANGTFQLIGGTGITATRAESWGAVKRLSR